MNRGKGEIDYAQISNFEGFSNNGKMDIMITNTGQLTAEFNLFFDCDKDISSIPYQKLFLDPLQSKIFKINVETNNIKTKNHTCEIFLKDAIGEILDSIKINFTTTEIKYSSIY